MKRTFARYTLLAIATGCALLLAVPMAEAATPSITTVKQCASDGSCPGTIASNGIAHDTVQVGVHVSSGTLENVRIVRLSARSDTSQGYTCLVQWSTNFGLGASYTNSFKWGSTKYPASPSGCTTANGNNTSQYGKLTPNGTVQFRVESYNGNAWNDSSAFAVQLNNAPGTPAWAADPSVAGADQRHPVVTLRWNAAPEPDIKEYRFLRTDSSGQEVAFPVSAANYAQQGCSFDGATYTCYDTNFPSSGFGGTYSYAVIALRPSPSSSETCYFDQSNCISSQTSAVKSVSMTEPPAPTPTQTAGTSRGGTGQTSLTGPATVPTGTPSIPTSSRDAKSPTHVLGQSYGPNDCFTCGTYKETLPYGSLPGDGTQSGGTGPSTSQQRPILAAGSGVGSQSEARDPRQLWVSLAGGLLLLLTAAHVARILRATAH